MEPLAYFKEMKRELKKVFKEYSYEEKKESLLVFYEKKSNKLHVTFELDEKASKKVRQFETEKIKPIICYYDSYDDNERYAIRFSYQDQIYEVIYHINHEEYRKIDAKEFEEPVEYQDLLKKLEGDADAEKFFKQLDEFAKDNAKKLRLQSLLRTKDASFVVIN